SGPPGGRLIVVTSPGPGEGKTSSAVNLAAAFAETGTSTIVVGADLRQPGLARYLGLSEEPGITDVLSAQPGSTPPRVIRRTAISDLSVLTSGSPVDNPAGVLTRGRDLIAQCRRFADIVIIDTAPLLVANDAVELILTADAVVLVGRYGTTTAESADAASELLHRLKVPVIGVAMLGQASAQPAPYRSRPSGKARRRGRSRGRPMQSERVAPPTDADQAATSFTPPDPLGGVPTRSPQ
ncbi:MAG: CpsD/CapB family tyrosine-protein kinase, partial [Candidatus Dormibacteraeota bacterium]|nr:CpsD/CapB family tyrosine-protein kinase [Candidatus Dormibacteraeota bacterium]